MIATIFDTETSGLIDNHIIRLDKQPYVIELYGCSVNLVSGQIVAEIDKLIRPPSSDDLPAKITEITGISWQMLEAAPQFRDIADEVGSFLTSNNCLIAHNLSFDMEMIDLEFERLGQTIVWPRRKICSVEQTIHVKGYRMSLTDLHLTLFNEPFPDAHRAKADVMALVRCCVELHRREMI